LRFQFEDEVKLFYNVTLRKSNLGIHSMRGTSILVGLIIVLGGGRMGFPVSVRNRSAESAGGERTLIT